MVEIPDSPLADGFPDTMDENVPPPIGSPTSFTPPSAKWSGARRPPPAPAMPKLGGPNKALPKLGVTRSGGLARPPAPTSMRPPTSKAAIGATANAAKANAAKASFPSRSFPAKAGGPMPPQTRPPHGLGPNATLKISAKTLSPSTGYVFVCTSQTMREVASKKLFGSPDRDFEQMKQIRMDTPLFLLNLDTLKMLGPFAPQSMPAKNIIPGSFGGRFNAQIRVAATDGLLETQIERKIPTGWKDAGSMKLVSSFMDKGQPAPIPVQRDWGLLGGGAGAAVGGPAGGMVPRPTQLQGGARPAPSLALTRTNSGNFGNGPQLSPRAGQLMPRHPPAGGPRGPRPPGQAGQEARTDKFVPGQDKEGRQYNLQLVVVNFANVGASYASTVLKKDNKRGDRLFDWEGVRKCLKCLTQELGLQAVGCIMENYWGPDNGSAQKPIPDDIRAMCSSIQETPSLTGKNHKSADDEMTIKCAWRRNCRFMDNDNYRDWLKEMRDNRVRNWIENHQEMLQMRYFFDSDLGTFDTLDGNVPMGLLAEASKCKQMGFGAGR
uniref:DCD domain-containing protein n=1 Tax=Zooxanthella nutricula TaxID=1333877 RepID=A0A7S2VIX3_9DINO